MESRPTLVTNAEGKALEASLRRQAKEWRRRLDDPVTKKLIKSGHLTVSPLVTELLKAFPPS